MFKNMKIKSKLLTLMLLVTIVPQLLVGIITYKEINNLNTKAQEFGTSLGQTISSKCSDFSTSQAKEYSLSLAIKHADEINSTLQKVAEQVESIAISLEYMHKSKKTLNGYLLPLPEMNSTINKNDRSSITGSIFAVDPKNICNESVLAYNIKDYSTMSNKSVYSTNITKYLTLKDPAIKKISENSFIVSENYAPEKILNEMKFLSNIEYLTRSIYTTNKKIENIFIGTESGIRYSLSGFGLYTRYLPSSRGWYKDAINKKDHTYVWQSTYKSASSGNYCTTCSKTFRDSQGNVLGVVGIDVDFTEFINELNKANEGKDWFTFIIDKKGKIIASTEYNTVDKEPLKNANIAESHRALLNSMIKGEAGVSETLLYYNNKNYVTAYTPITCNSWSLCVATPIAEIEKLSSDVKNNITKSVKNSVETTKQSYTIKNLFYVALFIIILSLTVLLTVFLSKLITNPLTNLTNNIKKIGTGNLEGKLEVKSKDEIGELSNEFNKMKNDLKNYIEKLKKTTVEKVKLNSELNVAKTIQEDMLPCIFPKFSNQKAYDLFATMNPAKAIGGDFYDFFSIDEDNLCMVIADVSGKSISAALFMVITKTLIKNYASMGFSPEKVFSLVNKQLCENNKAEMFVTSFMAIINLKTGIVTYCNAGHNKPLLYKKGENKFNWLNTKHSFVLAGIDTVKYKSETLKINSGDALYLYTDGVTEAMNTKKELYSDEKLIKTLNSYNISSTSSEDILKSIKQSIEDFRGTEPQADDITMLMFKYFGNNDNSVHL